MKSRQKRFIVIASFPLMVAACSTQRLNHETSPLVIAECKPPLRPLDGDTMGDLLNWAVYAAGRFNRCSAAAMGIAD